MRRLLTYLARCRRGMAALEFAIVAPTFVAIVIGAIAVVDVARANKRVSATATALSDLTTRVFQVDDELLSSFYTTASVLMDQFDDDMQLTIVISSVVADDGDVEVSWSQANDHGVPLTNVALENISLPTIPDGESVILVEVSGDYRPLLLMNGFPTLSLAKTAVRRPRFVPEVAYIATS